MPLSQVTPHRHRPDHTAVAPTPPCVYPLDEFYLRAGLPLPHIERIPGDQVPEPYRTLLVHHKDMTPTLEEFHGSDIYIEALGRQRNGHFYFREVILRKEGSGQPVEFGANKIDLSLYRSDLRDLILKEHVPLGRILKMGGVSHGTRPMCFLRLTSDELIERSFGLAERQILYGRRARISDPDGRPLSEIVEILPPLLAK